MAGVTITVTVTKYKNTTIRFYLLMLVDALHTTGPLKGSLIEKYNF